MTSNNPLPFQRYAHDRALGSTVQPQDLNEASAPERHTIRHRLAERLQEVRQTLQDAREHGQFEETKDI